MRQERENIITTKKHTGERNNERKALKSQN